MDNTTVQRPRTPASNIVLRSTSVICWVQRLPRSPARISTCPYSNSLAQKKGHNLIASYLFWATNHLVTMFIGAIADTLIALPNSKNIQQHPNI